MIEETHPSLLKRKIIHFDMDCFYAAVEIRDDPYLKGKPVIIGGSPDSRGVVATCSYEARKFGIHSAMASAYAYKLCPQAIFVRGHFDKYREVSNQIKEIFSRYTKFIEPIALDEAYLDVTDHELYATEIAKKIKDNIATETGLTGSAGVAPNKLLAKIASDMNKPNGITVVQPHRAKEFMKNLSLRKINGIGPATEKKLLSHKLKICSNLWPYKLSELEEKIGERLGRWLYDRTRGIDDRAVVTSRIRKSLGSETTFASDILDTQKLEIEITKVAEKVSKLLIKRQLSGKTITLKVKYADFKRITRAKTLETETNKPETLILEAIQLLKKTEAGIKAIRLIGVSISNFSS